MNKGEQKIIMDKTDPTQTFAVVYQGTQKGMKDEPIGETYLVILSDGNQTSVIVRPGEDFIEKLREVRKRFTCETIPSTKSNYTSA